MALTPIDFILQRGRGRPSLRPSFKALGGADMPTTLVFPEVDDVDHWLHSPGRPEVLVRWALRLSSSPIPRSRPGGADRGSPPHRSLPEAHAVRSGDRRHEARWCPSRHVPAARKGIPPQVKARFRNPGGKVPGLHNSRDAITVC